MKRSVSFFLLVVFAFHSVSGLAQSYVDNSYGYLDPKEIYAQSKYFNAARIKSLEDTNGIPTPIEVAQLKNRLAQLKNVARTEAFGKKVIPMAGVAVAYPFISAGVFVASLVATTALSLCTARVAPYGISLWSPLASGLMLNSAVNMIMGDPGLVDTFQHLYGGAPAKDALIDLEAEYVAHKHLIPDHLQNKAEEILFSTRLGGTPAGTANSFISTLVAFQKSQTRSCAITKDWPSIEKEISEALKRNSGETREQILNLAYAYYTNSKSDSTLLPRLVASFNGVPGVGKSRAADLVANAFGVPVVKVSLAGLSPKDLWGTAIGEGGEPGVLVTKMAELGCDSGIMKLEDIDHAVTSGVHAQSLGASLLELFDTTQMSFWSKFLTTNGNTSKIFMVLTANSEFAQKALQDRVTPVAFEEYPKAVKEAIIFEEYLPNRLQILGIAEADFAPEMDKLKLEIAEDKNTGLRTIHQIVEKTLAKFGRAKAKSAKN